MTLDQIAFVVLFASAVIVGISYAMMQKASTRASVKDILRLQALGSSVCKSHDSIHNHYQHLVHKA